MRAGTNYPPHLHQCSLLNCVCCHRHSRYGRVFVQEWIGGLGWGGPSLTKRETFTFVNDSRQVASSAEDAVLPSNLFRGREKKKKAYEGQFVWKRSMHGGCREKTHTISHALARAQTQKHRQGLAETLPTVFRLDLSPEAREQRHICLSYTEPCRVSDSRGANFLGHSFSPRPSFRCWATWT